MKSNFHTHTFRCNHANGTEREYIEEAIKVGFKTFGFADHCPYIFDGDYYSDFRMRPEQTEEYVKTLLDLKEEYKKDIDIYIGLEVEYYPKHFQKFLDFVKPFNFDYYILGQHYTLNEYDGKHTFSHDNTEKDLDDYVNGVLAGADTGLFSYIAHPDMCLFPDEKIFEKQMRRICEKAKQLSLPVELNFNGLIQNREYPNENFFRLAAEYGNDVILGLDAHNTELIRRVPELEKKALSMLDKFGIKPVDKIKLLNGKTV